MATPTYSLIDSIEVGSSTPSVTFSSLTQDYRDLVVNWQTLTGAGSQTLVRLNNDSGGNYHQTQIVTFNANMYVGQSNGDTYYRTERIIAGLSFMENTEFTVMDYSATDKNKCIFSRTTEIPTSNGRNATASGRWQSNAAVTSITIFNSNNFVSGDSIHIYGIEA
jgi:hypothetical protein